ncbi:hypothetical protein A3Q56_07858, partial [Intoshia linei]
KDVYKSPITEPMKMSKKGKLILTKNHNGLFETLRLTVENKSSNILNTVFLDGDLIIDHKLEDIRSRVKSTPFDE